MKKIGLTIGLCLVTLLSFGQKKAVTDALKLAKNAKPNFTEARTKISEALQHAETKNDAQAWFTAGQIENLQFDAENTKQILGQQPDQEVMYNALLEVYPYFVKANELDNLPDAKGKVKPKFTKDIKSIIKANLGHYMNGGVYFFEQNDYKKSYDFFDQYVIISDGPMLKESATAATAAVDSNYIYANYYAAIAALQSDNFETFVNAANRAKKLDFRQMDIYQYLIEEYKKVNDVANLEKTLNEGLALFPKEPYFILNLIDMFLKAENNEKALEYINKAIQEDPTNTQLLDVAGRIYETGFKDNEKAEEFFKRSIAINGENAESQSNLGRIYFNQGVVQLEKANSISDVQQFNQEKEIALELFRKAMPYLEKALKIDPDNSDSKIGLRSIYYNLNMNDKFEEISKLMGGNGE